MRCVVHKYGGSSVADLARIRGVAERIARTRAEGVGVVAVVSAMGNTTNELLALARQVTPTPDRRELDMLISVGERITMSLLAITLRDLGVPARSLTGSQSGIITDEAHADARVVEVRPERVRRCLEEGDVVIVAGFQGVSRAREVTTLGRGGSDTTAVVLAAALGAEHCEICSDVDGVWSADPRLVPDARRRDTLGLDEALALARGGAKVLFEDAVRYARDHGVEIVATTTFGPGAGTRLTAQAGGAEGAAGVTSDAQLLRVELPPGRERELVAEVRRRGGRVRRWLRDALHVDTRNAHGDLGLEGVSTRPAVVVTAAGSGLGERADLGLEVRAVLEEAGVTVADAGGAGDALWWEVDAAHEVLAVRLAHGRLARP